jgi:hypothetical protein
MAIVKTSTLKLDSEDAPEETPTSFNAEDTVMSETMTSQLTLTSDVLANGYNQKDQTSRRKVITSLSAELPQVGYGEEERTRNGDQSLPTTSGITTTVLISSVEILDMVKVLEPEPETITTTNNSMLKLDIEDAQEETLISSNAESMVDQTKVTDPLMLMSNAQVDHGLHIT